MREVERDRPSRRWAFYLVAGVTTLLTLLMVAAAIHFWEEMQHAQAYGYAGGFLVSIMGGITIIPAPSLLVIFTLGRVVRPIVGPEYVGPVFIGLVSGLGEALGGITVYLTGAGAETIWSRLWPRRRGTDRQLDPGFGIATPVESQFWSKGEAFYNRLVNWVGGRRGSWVVFVTSAMPLSPFYFAGLAAGSLRMGLLRFFLVSLAGKTIKGMIIAFAGYWGLYFLPQWLGVFE